MSARSTSGEWHSGWNGLAVHQPEAESGPSRAWNLARTDLGREIPTVSPALRASSIDATLPKWTMRINWPPWLSTAPRQAVTSAFLLFGCRPARNPSPPSDRSKCARNRPPPMLDIRRIPGSTGDRNVPLGLNSQRRDAVPFETHRRITSRTRCWRHSSFPADSPALSAAGSLQAHTTYSHATPL
jgi:hypothetical protein